MGWVREEGAHEGTVGMLLRDGAIASGWQGHLVLVDTDPDGQELASDAWQGRAEADVVGWVPRCSCGWNGDAWTRSPEPWDTDYDNRIVYSPDSHVPDDLEDGLLHERWQRHIAPDSALAGLGALAARAR